MTGSLDFKLDGAAFFAGAALSILPPLDVLAASVPRDRAGIRLHGIGDLDSLLGADTAVQRIAASLIGEGAVPVRAILFDKTPSTNWSLGWHQDRTIAVKTRTDRPGFGPWTVKQGIQHVEPPFAVIQRMATLRIHLDDTPANNAPLLVARGSHRLGRIEEGDIDQVVSHCGIHRCIAKRGDIWAYATPILHASAAASAESAHRRVLQVDYADDALPTGLQWLGL